MSEGVVTPLRTADESRHLAGSDERGVRPRDLARQLNVAPNVIYNAIRAEEMKPWRFGKAIVLPVDEVNRWLESKAS